MQRGLLEEEGNGGNGTQASPQGPRSPPRTVGRGDGGHSALARGRVCCRGWCWDREEGLGPRASSVSGKTSPSLGVTGGLGALAPDASPGPGMPWPLLPACGLAPRGQPRGARASSPPSSWGSMPRPATAPHGLPHPSARLSPLLSQWLPSSRVFIYVAPLPALSFPLTQVPLTFKA